MDNTTKTVYSYDTDGKLIGSKVLDYTDRSPISGRWQIPANCTEVEPPANKDGYDIIWRNGWQYQEQPKSEEDSEQPEQDDTQISDVEYVNEDTIVMAETIVDLYDQLDILNNRLTVIEGGDV